MGKIRTRLLGLEDVEKKQKEDQRKRAAEKKKIRAPGLKGGERMVEVVVGEAELEKLKKAKEIISESDRRQKTHEKKPKEKIKKQRGKKYSQSLAQIDKNKTYSITEAIEILRKIKYARFDETFEAHINVNEVGLKGEIEFPHSFGKKTRVVIASEEVLSKIEKNEIDFDVLISHPSFMPKLLKYAKILGPRGLMPNPKMGTLSSNPEEAAKKFAKGNLRWKTEAKFPIVHLVFGKLSMDDQSLRDNFEALIKSLGKKNIKSVFVKTTMSPALKVKLE